MNLMHAHTTLAALSRFARPQPLAERCDLCGAALGEGHDHLLAAKSRQLACACTACSMLFFGAGEGKYRRIEPCVVPLPEVQLEAEHWSALAIPVRLVFISVSLVDARVLALYPNAAGLTETAVPSAAWQALVRAHRSLGEIEPEVQGLLIDGLSERCRCYRVSIDVCHRLVGMMRGKPGRNAVSSHDVVQLLHGLGGGSHA